MVKREKAVTLIALIITIIILLILAGVAFNSLLGSNGLLNRTSESAEKSRQSANNEEIALQEFENEIEYWTNKGAEEGQIPSEWEEHVDKVRSDGVPIPKGFTYVTGTKDTGTVIEDGNGNQFVWVPVSNINDMVDKANKRGQLYDFQIGAHPGTPPTIIPYSTSEYREPAVLTNNGPIPSATDSDSQVLGMGISGVTTRVEFETFLQAEFDEMAKSVEKYKGFYIGRYETGGSATELKVQLNEAALVDQSWYTFYKKQMDMYPNTSNVVSSMIWGCQWDATLTWLRAKNELYVINSTSTSEGNYTGSVKPTGYYTVNNIYDMAGNVGEWTIEAYTAQCRILRRRRL